MVWYGRCKWMIFPRRILVSFHNVEMNAFYWWIFVLGSQDALFSIGNTWFLVEFHGRSLSVVNICLLVKFQSAKFSQPIFVFLSSSKMLQNLILLLSLSLLVFFLSPMAHKIPAKFNSYSLSWRSAVAEWLRRRGASLGVPGSIPGAGNSYALQALEQGC